MQNRTNRVSHCFLSAAAAMCIVPSIASAQTAPARSESITIGLDSGVHSNRGESERVVWSDTIEVTGATWVRLYFEEASLSLDPATGESSIVRIMSMFDGAVQHHSARTIEQWNLSSAYFNGDTVSIELIAMPGAENDRIVVGTADKGIFDDTQWPSTICGSTDDRLPSQVMRTGRAWPIGCTAWIIDDAHHQFLTAGHCAGSSLQIVEFNVPLSNREGTAQHPGPEDQYAVDVSSKQTRSGGVGNDWGYFGVYRNTETGMTPYQVQGEFYTLASTPPPVNGQNIRITGYGTTGGGIPREWNLAQKTHVGPYWVFSGTTVRYRTDTSGGNSGSAVINEDTGEAIGIHTHGGCDGGNNSSNQGTGINHPDIQNALNSPRGVCAPFNLNVPTLRAGQMATFEATGTTANDTVYFVYTLQGAGSYHAAQLGVTLSIANPKLAGSAVSDGGGVARLTRLIPNAGANRTIWIQAAEVGRVSVVRQTTIQ